MPARSAPSKLKAFKIQVNKPRSEMNIEIHHKSDSDNEKDGNEQLVFETEQN